MDNVRNFATISHHEGRPVCAACGHCSKNTGIMFCNTCKRNVHYLCHLLAKPQPNNAGYCQGCHLMPNDQNDPEYSEWMRRLIHCECIIPGSTSSVPMQSEATNTLMTSNSVPESGPGIIPKTEDSTIGEDTFTGKRATSNSNCRRSQRMAAVGEVSMPDKFRIMGEYFSDVMEEDTDLDDDDDQNIGKDMDVVIEVEDDSDIEEEPLFAMRDHVVYLHGDSEIISGKIIGRVLNANVMTDFVQGCELPHTQPGWSYAVRTRDAEEGDTDYLRWKHESSLIFDTGDDHGTGSDEEELENMAE